MSGKSFVYENTYVRKIRGLYFDSRTSDVNFVFDVDTDHPEKVPAHKAILSLHNAAFDAMFYGPVKEGSDIPISDACAAAFKEFLQFFYLDEVRLSTEHIVQVINLCKKYEMDECMEACETTMQKSLIIDDMCSGYSIALVLEQKNLTEFCEDKIKTNAQEIIKSKSFLEAGRTLLEKILTLVSSSWHASETVMACMEWAKAECSRNNLETSPENLRTQLGEICNRIPFEKLTLDQFSQHAYDGFFNAEEIVAMNNRIQLHSRVYYSYFERTNDDELIEMQGYRQTLSEARRLKHAADAVKSGLSHAILHTEAAIHFLMTGIAMERDAITKKKTFKMYNNSKMYLKYMAQKYQNQQLRLSRKGNIHTKLSILNLRCQSLLNLKLYKLKKYELELSESNEHPETLSAYLSESHELWDLADSTVINGNYKDFFIALDHEHGPITLHSSLSELVKYVQDGIQKLKQM